MSLASNYGRASCGLQDSSAEGSLGQVLRESNSEQDRDIAIRRRRAFYALLFHGETGSLLRRSKYFHML